MVNCVQEHPSLPVVAVSGIDDDIKIWEPFVRSSDSDDDGQEHAEPEFYRVPPDKHRDVVEQARHSANPIYRLYFQILL